MKGIKNYFTGSLLLIATVFISLPSHAETTLRFAHFFPAVAGISRDLLVPWAQSVEQASQGELKIQIFPGQIMLRSDALYQGTVHGVADISLTVLGYNSSKSALIDSQTVQLGRFPNAQIVELPGIANTAYSASCIAQSLFDEGLVADDFNDTKVLWLFTTGPGHLHTANKEIRSPADLKGLKIRQPGPVAKSILEELGATPVGMPAPAIYSAMERNRIDGVMFPWEGMKTFRVNELANYHTEAPFYSLSFVMSMNKLTYKRLPPHLKAVIDQHSGLEWSKKGGLLMDQIDEAGRSESKGDIINIEDPLSNPNWRGPLTNAINGYLNAVSILNPDARQVYQRALALQESCQQ